MAPESEEDPCSQKTTVTVDPGVCRFTTEIVASADGGRVVCDIKSDCPCVKELSEMVKEVDPFEALRMPYSGNPIYAKAGEVLRHSTCPVPLAILKCIEATAGLALKRDVKVEFES